jgi:CubicO group peptidase (beta-lactamase class C family)
MDFPIGGHVEPGFEGVRTAFENNFAAGLETGAGFCLHVEGRKVVDLHGGYFDRERTRPYGADALQLIFSSTKGATAACANLLAQRGQLDLDAPVASYWPEFAAAGKENLPVRYLLTHQAGLPAVDISLSAEEVQAWDPAIKVLAAQEPLWEPGSAHGYHAVSYGYLVGEVVRRITGRSLGRYFADEIAGPLNLEFFIGLPAELEERVSPIIGSLLPEEGTPGLPADFATTLLARALNFAGAFSDPAWMNQPAWHAADMPAANGITNAASLSRLYAGLIGTVEGGPSEPILTTGQVDAARTVHTSGPDQVFGSLGFPLEQHIGLGFWVASPFAFFGGEGGFGHGGAGGSYGFADPANRLGVGYVMNQMSVGLTGDARSHALIEACYHAIGETPTYF